MVKGGIDVVGAAIGLIVLSPVLAWTALAILVVQGRPILFKQTRPGLNGDLFTIVKFRTMRSATPDEVWYLTDNERTTRLGRFLRASSLDELPELWNVLRGDMSLVGPRPFLREYLEAYTPEEARRHEMRPGMTGWAVVNGRSSIQFKERVALDLWYIDHWSLALDARILALTVLQVLRRENESMSNDRKPGFPIAGLTDDMPDPPGSGAGRSSGTATVAEPEALGARRDRAATDSAEGS